MVFKCQEDSFRREFTSKVVSCEPTTEPIVEYGKVSKFEGYQITLENTILFPAGGGQPHDIGWLNNEEVLQVIRKGDEAIHFTRNPIDIGTVVEQKIDWNRRFDHMQQHSGQHLLSAILEQDHNLPTTSWWLGSDESYVELSSTDVTADVIERVEVRCNELIRLAVPVRVKFCRIDDPDLNEFDRGTKNYDLTTSWWLGSDESYVELSSTDVTADVIERVEARCNELIRLAVPVRVKFCKIDDPDLNEAHTRGLPKDCMDTIRIICIENIDENMCCGTHVSNLSQLQMIKLTGIEPGKKGKSNLKFLVGNRVIRSFNNMLERERAMTGLLKNEPSKHEELVQKLQKNFKITNKNLQNVLQELAQHEIDQIKKVKPKYVFMYKKEGTPEFNRVICKGLEGEEIFVFVASEDPDKPKEGQIVIQGPEEHCNVLGQQITDILKGKGAFKHGKFQGKAGDLSGINKCKKLVEEYFNKLE